MPEYSFCEPVTASAYSYWHIRRLTDKGHKYSGGADTDALCGRKVAWDLRIEILEHHLIHSCPTCREAYKKECATPTKSSSPG